jgi:hypothetical protein
VNTIHSPKLFLYSSEAAMSDFFCVFPKLPHQNSHFDKAARNVLTCALRNFEELCK